MTLDFVDLHSHSMYSVLDGVPEPDEIVAKAAELGRKAHALTDHGSISGHVAFERALTGKSISRKLTMSKVKGLGGSEAYDIKPIYGLEAYTTPDVTARGEDVRRSFHLSLLSKNLEGYRNILKLVTRSYDEGFYYRNRIDGRMLQEQGQGLIILSGCDTGGFMSHLAKGEYEAAKEHARTYKSIFGDDYYIEIQHYPHASERAQLAWQISQELGIEPVLTCDSHYLSADDGPEQQRFLWSIRDGKPADETNFIEYAYLWEPDRLLAFCYEQQPGVKWERLFENTVNIAEKVDPIKLPKAPHVRYPMEGDKLQYIYQRCRHRLDELGLTGTDYEDRLRRELDVIAAKEYEDYFLLVADMVGWAKSKGIFVGPARGSAAGSLICYGLRITEVDPLRYGLMFERFVDPSRIDTPDIDVDFEDERRHEVFEYMRERWGRDNVAQIATFSKLGDKKTLDDAAKSYKIPKAEVETIKQHLVERSSGDQRAELTVQDTIDEFPEARAVMEKYPQLKVAASVQGRIRHLGKHAAGLVVTSEPIVDYVATYRPGGKGDPLVAVDWRDADYLNLMKIDVLGLKELSILRHVCEQIGWTFEDMYQIPLDDPKTIQGFNNKDYLGIFQYTGLATKGVASQIEFKDVEQISAVNALSRPGPLHAGATEKYIKGAKAGNYKPVLETPLVQPMIAETYGQIIYQEQVMRILREIGEMSWNDVCDIRQIMGKTKGSEAFDAYWEKWLAGTTGRGVSEEIARDIWECIRLYGKHSFNKSHAVSYGIVAYYSMYMKQHHPREFYAAQLRKANEDDQIRFVQSAYRRGLEFAPVSLDIDSPTWTVGSDGKIHPGWSFIKGVGDKSATELSAHAPYEDMEDLTERVTKRVVNSKIRRLIEESLGLTPYDVYGLKIWDTVDEALPERRYIEEVNAGDGGEVTIAGRLTHINKKNRVEEYRTKGKRTEHLEGLQDYAILILEDETDSMMAYLRPQKYDVIKSQLYSMKDEIIWVTGKKLPGIQLIHIEQMGVLD